MNFVNISLNPTYLCNFRCEFCYLTPEQLADNRKLDLNRLIEMFKEMKAAGYRIDMLDLYGGEIGLLSEDYLNKMRKILTYAGAGDVNIITNLYKIHPHFLHPHNSLSVSFDFEARERHELVLSNIMQTPKDVAILMLASPKLMEQDVDKMIKTFNALKNVISVEIKPYSANQANVLKSTDKDFEEFVKKWLTSSIPKNFTFTNVERIRDSLSGSYVAYSDSHVYITPMGKFAVLEFDDNDNEYFLEMDTFVEYVEWSKKEKLKVNKNPICNACPYLGKCLTEHYRDVKSLENSCNGFRFLLDWSQANRHLIDS